MNLLLIFLLAMPQLAARIAHSKSIEEGTYTDVVKIPEKATEPGAGLGKVRYQYPKGFLISPRCYDVRDREPGPGPWISRIDEEGFTVSAPLGHEVAITCRTLKAKKPLA